MKNLFLLSLFLFFSFMQNIEAKTEIVGYPTFDYSNETGFCIGGLIYIRYRPQHFEENVPKNLIYLSTAYSEKKQFGIYFDPILYLQNGRYAVSFPIEFMKWPSKFYGIGNNTSKENKEDFTPQQLNIQFNLKRIITQYWSISLHYEFNKYNILKVEEDGLLKTGNVKGSDDNLISGTGFSISMDQRDSNSYPKRGYLYCFKPLFFTDILGSEYNFIKYSLDLRQYFSITPKQVLALQGYFSCIQKDPPFHKLSYLNNYMRATTPNLFIDRHMAIFRSEYRFFPWETKILERIGFVGFMEVGQVAHELGEFTGKAMKFNYGFGLRYSFLMDDRFNLRIDLGFGGESGALSIGSEEVF